MTDPDACPRYDYAIDDQDRIAHAGGRWDAFARENDSVHLLTERVVGTKLWDHVTGSEVRHLYRAMFAGLRNGAGPIDVPFRCDSPALRRYMCLRMRADRSGAITFTSTLLRTEPREPVALLGAHHTIGTSLLQMCSFCKRAMVDDTWVEVETAVQRLELFEIDRMPRLTHGVCPDCLADFAVRMGK